VSEDDFTEETKEEQKTEANDQPNFELTSELPDLKI
jgi:hypothetical protein